MSVKKPANLSDAEKYIRLGLAVTNKQRGLLSLLIKNSREGKWTTYADAKEFGINTASKRMSELILIGGLGIVSRDKIAKDENGRNRHVCEFCVV